MPHCKNCGEEIIDDASFCLACGSRLSVDDSKAPIKDQSGTIKKSYSRKYAILLVIVIVLFVGIGVGTTINTSVSSSVTTAQKDSVSQSRTQASTTVDSVVAKTVSTVSTSTRVEMSNSSVFAGMQDDFSGGFSKWMQISGDWIINEGVLVNRAVNREYPRIEAKDVVYSNINMSIDIRFVSTPKEAVDWAGVLVRSGETQENYDQGYLVVAYPNGAQANSIVLYKASGDITLLKVWKIPDITVNTWHTLRVVLQDSTINVFWDNNAVGNVLDTTYVKGSLRIVNNDNGYENHFDNLSMNSLQM